MVGAMTTRITHWIDGRSDDGHLRTHRPRSTTPPPASRPAEVDLASADEVDAAVASAPTAAAASGGTPSLSPPRRRCSSRSASCSHQRCRRARRRSSPPSTARCSSDAARRDRPRPRERRVRLRRAAAAQGRLQRAGRDRRRRLLASASRSASSPASRRSTSRPWCRCGCAPTPIACGNAFILKPSEKDPSAALFLAELWKEAGLPDGVFTVVHGDKVAVDAILDHPGIAAVSFVGSTPIAALHLRDAAPPTASGSRPSAARRTTCWCCPTPTSTWPPTRSSPRPTARPASGAWRSRSPSPSATSADPLVDAIAARLPKLTRRRRRRPRHRHGPADHRASTATRSPATSTRASRPARRVVVDGRDRRPTRSEGFFLGTTLLDHVTPEMTVYTDEIFGPVLSVVRVDTYDEGIALINANQYANGTAIFTRDGGAARQFQYDVEVGMVGINVPDPGAGRLLLLRRLEGLAVRRHPHVRPGGHQLLHPGQGRHLALARPGHLAASTSASPGPADGHEHRADPLAGGIRPTRSRSGGRPGATSSTRGRRRR